MKYLMCIITAVFLLISFVSCSSYRAGTEKDNIKEEGRSTAYKNIAPSEAKKRLESEKDIVLLDVRTKEEYNERHIPDSILIPVDVLSDEAEDKLPDKNVPVFVYCRSGRRSITASEILIKKGYTNVYNLGGIIDWPYETKTGS
ncbi:MAG: rhodanese-like domain-containing protein [Bacillota bacterium]